MKPIFSDDSLDELIAAALHGDLTPEEQTAFESRLNHDPAARAAYLETQLMHDLLEKTNREAQPDPAFEQRMVSGVRRKIRDGEQAPETAWDSVVVLWRWVRAVLGNQWVLGGGMAVIMALVIILAVSGGTSIRRTLAMNAIDFKAIEKDGMGSDDSDFATFSEQKKGEAKLPVIASPSAKALETLDKEVPKDAFVAAAAPPPFDTGNKSSDSLAEADGTSMRAAPAGAAPRSSYIGTDTSEKRAEQSPSAPTAPASSTTTQTVQEAPTGSVSGSLNASNSPAPDSRKLIRNAQLDLEVKNYQEAIDQIGALTKEAGGYVDTSNSQRGGNGKLQGNVVVKVLPQNLDGFLVKLRDLGEIKNQSISTDDVTKEYYDTRARLDNSRRMETQLQELLKRDTGKISELLEVERELGRVRGEIEQRQGELKLYDFEVQYATVTFSVEEKDLNQAAAYLLQERDDFSLFATDVEATFQKARLAADEFKAQVLQANLIHDSGSDVAATLTASVPPEQIEAFLDRVRSLGRVANFTRRTDRVARDGGDTNQPADQTRTENDRVLVNVSIRSDDDSRKQVAMTVVTPAVDAALEKAKAAALASPGAEIMNSSLNRTAQGQSTAQISVRVPGKNYRALLDAFRGLGRTSSFSLQRDDNAGPNAAGDDAPVILSLALTDTEIPLQQTELAVRADDVDGKAQQLKKDAAANGVEVKASSFEREPNGVETAQMTFRLPQSAYPAFLDKLKNLGTVETLTVHREDDPDEARTDDSAPVEIGLELHNQGSIVADDNGLWATLRRTFGEGAAALMGSVRMIGVMLAFLAPWFILLTVVAWAARRIYVRRRR